MSHCKACPRECSGVPSSCRCHWYQDPLYRSPVSGPTLTEARTFDEGVVLKPDSEGNAALIVDQPAPVPTGGRPVWELVIEDMQARDHVGRQRYGMPLQAGNGRDALIDMYQELLDAAVYCRQLIAERNGR